MTKKYNCNSISTYIDIDMKKCNCKTKKKKGLCCHGRFLAISDQNRLRILKLLSKKELPVYKICEKLNLAQNLVSHHLGVLSDNKLVYFRKDGNNVYYRLNRKAVFDLSQLLKLLNK